MNDNAHGPLEVKPLNLFSENELGVFNSFLAGVEGPSHSYYWDFNQSPTSLFTPTFDFPDSGFNSQREDQHSIQQVTQPLVKNVESLEMNTQRGLLSDQQRKLNHIESEKKRRKNIKQGLTTLQQIVPGLSNGNKSEAGVLQKTIEYIKALQEQKQELLAYIRSSEGNSAISVSQ